MRRGGGFRFCCRRAAAFAGRIAALCGAFLQSDILKKMREVMGLARFKAMPQLPWSRLDNAAKIFPPTSSARDTKVFRLACTLTQPVEPLSLIHI